MDITLDRRLFLLFCFGMAIGCGDPVVTTPSGDGSSSGSLKPIKIVCTTNIVKDIVRRIGGSRVDVSAIMDGPGIDPHTYTPSPKDTNALTAADLVVYSGLHLEGQLEDALESLEHRGIPVICLTKGLQKETPSRLIQTVDGIADPHVWFDPDLWAACGNWLATELSAVDEDGIDEYTANAKAFTELMQTTLAASKTALRSVPQEARVLVTAHDAFEYFSRAFDFKVEAVQGISTDSEPGLRRINELIGLLSEKKIKAVFTEQSVSDKNIMALVAGCEAKGHKLVIGARLFSDTAGAEDTTEAGLSGALLYNTQKIAEALGQATPVQTQQSTPE